MKGGRKNWDEHETTTTNDAPQVGPTGGLYLWVAGNWGAGHLNLRYPLAVPSETAIAAATELLKEGMKVEISPVSPAAEVPTEKS